MKLVLLVVLLSFMAVMANCEVILFDHNSKVNIICEKDSIESERYAANELGEFGIRVNAVSGGPIDTDALKAFTNYEEVKAKTAEYSPLNRIGQPEDLAQSCYFLCTSDASWITGHTLIVDGGTTFR